MRFGAGEIILREGEPASRFYMIRDGEVEIYHLGPDDKEDVVGRLGPGQYFGEVALLHSAKRMASVRAATDVSVVSMEQREFDTLVRSLGPLRQAIERIASARERADDIVTPA
jgi:CRP-like cAMP-binding protein